MYAFMYVYIYVLRICMYVCMNVYNSVINSKFMLVVVIVYRTVKVISVRSVSYM